MPFSSRSALGLSLALTLGPTWLARPARAQLDWRRTTPAFPTQFGPMAQDPITGRVVMVAAAGSAAYAGAMQTWVWDGNVWSLADRNGPASRYFTALAFDSARGRVVMFGGLVTAGGSRSVDETWEWDGTQWSQRTPAVTPGGRSRHALAYDQARGRVVMFGGVNTIGAPATDTWEWDGTSWTQVATAAAPLALTGHALVYHAASRRTVLFGGRRGNTATNETWLFDGANWSQATPVVSPAARADMAAALDARGDVLVQGGVNSAGDPHIDTWRFDGSQWNTYSPLRVPVRLASPAMGSAPIRGRNLVVARDAQSVNQVYEWEGTNWNARTVRTPVPASVGAVAEGPLAFYYALDQLWRAGNGRFVAQPQAGPGIVVGSALAFDTRRQRLVMFGGGEPAATDATWELDIQRPTWTRAQPATSPPPQLFASMVYDDARGACVLLVANLATQQGETWVYDGVNWSNRAPVGNTPYVFDSALAYDAVRQRVVMFGGRVPSGQSSDTFEWDGTSWQRQQPATVPPSRSEHALAYDATRRVVVLFGGKRELPTGRVLLADSWEWNGSDWRPVVLAHQPPARENHVLWYDATLGGLVLFGGLDEFGPLEDTWALTATPGGSAELYALSPCFGTLRRRSELTMWPGMSPLVGSTLQLMTTGLLPQSAALLMLGNSRTSFAGVPLPLDLAPSGMPGCLLAVGPLVNMGIGVGGSVLLSVPNDRSLVGASIFAQTVETDAGANAAGLTTANGLRLIFGSYR